MAWGFSILLFLELANAKAALAIGAAAKKHLVRTERVAHDAHASDLRRGSHETLPVLVDAGASSVLKVSTAVHTTNQSQDIAEVALAETMHAKKYESNKWSARAQTSSSLMRRSASNRKEVRRYPRFPRKRGNITNRLPTGPDRLAHRLLELSVAHQGVGHYAVIGSGGLPRIHGELGGMIVAEQAKTAPDQAAAPATVAAPVTTTGPPPVAPLPVAQAAPAAATPATAVPTTAAPGTVAAAPTTVAPATAVAPVTAAPAPAPAPDNSGGSSSTFTVLLVLTLLLAVLAIGLLIIRWRIQQGKPSGRLGNATQSDDVQFWKSAKARQSYRKSAIGGGSPTDQDEDEDSDNTSSREMTMKGKPSYRDRRNPKGDFSLTDSVGTGTPRDRASSDRGVASADARSSSYRGRRLQQQQSAPNRMRSPRSGNEAAANSGGGTGGPSSSAKPDDDVSV